MIESEWLESNEPESMLRLLMPDEGLFTDQIGRSLPVRKRRLFGAACSRLVWPLVGVNDRCRGAVDYLERLYDDDAIRNEFTERYWDEVLEAARLPDPQTPLFLILAAMLTDRMGDPLGQIRHLLRVAEEYESDRKMAARIADLIREVFVSPFRTEIFSPEFRTGDVVSLAKVAYFDRDPSTGALNNERLMILADAVQEAGCEEAALLEHLRGDGPHVRGCWVMDLILDKE